MFTHFGTSDFVEAKGIEQLISEFTTNASEFKNSMKSIDFAEKIKQNKVKNKLDDYMELSEPHKSSSTSIPKDKIKLSAKSLRDRKTGPIKAERIVIKKDIVKQISQP